MMKIADVHELKVSDAVPVTTIRELAVKSNSRHTKVLDHFKQFEKPRQLDKRVPHELRENEKDRHYEVWLCASFVRQQRYILRSHWHTR
ncbi:hypothetical protein AVEN_249-1 [Araneus ventricosus]|uniref:Mos1 transposase HTH domain-containing protein n=1 Tax=Araneus ventricosus TaxID=182803 RepID=A0A4Y2KM99_ARAVE|nr:hypothetical protein AVEN_249-1 [Araneus ventricosus]